MKSPILLVLLLLFAVMSMISAVDIGDGRAEANPSGADALLVRHKRKVDHNFLGMMLMQQQFQQQRKRQQERQQEMELQRQMEQQREVGQQRKRWQGHPTGCNRHIGSSAGC